MAKKELVKIKIDEDVVDPDDTEMLEDLVVVAVNDALKKSWWIYSKRNGKINRQY